MGLLDRLRGGGTPADWEALAARVPYGRFLGISVEALIAYFSGGAIPIDGGDVADVIADLCLDHSSSAATITIYVNGQIIAERPVTLGRKGDFIYAVDLVRTNGTWTAP